MCPGRHRIFIALIVTVSNWQQLKCPHWESGLTRTVWGTLNSTVTDDELDLNKM